MITCSFENGNQASPGLRHLTVGAIVLRDKQVLLGLRGTLDGKPIIESGKWSLLGGFFDRDENLVQAVRREVLEESGWEISEPKLFRINDNQDRPREDRQNVDMIFVADATEQVGKYDEEVKELRWFPLDSLPPMEEIAFDHGQDLEMYIQYLKSPQPLPIIG